MLDHGAGREEGGDAVAVGGQRPAETREPADEGRGTLRRGLVGEEERGEDGRTAVAGGPLGERVGWTGRTPAEEPGRPSPSDQVP
jgi:uncharacterized membrane protein